MSKPTKSDTEIANSGATMAAARAVGLMPDTYNLAVRFQCAVRDAIGWPNLSLDQALQIGREVFREFDLTDHAEGYRQRLQAEAETRERARLAEQKRISDTVKMALPE